MNVATAQELTLENQSSFWRWQVLGWLAYGVAMFIAAVQVLTLNQALVNKSVNVGLGFALSLGLRALYLKLRERGLHFPRLLGVMLASCLVAGAAWSVLANGFFWWYMRGSFENLDPRYLFAWTLVHTIVFVAWCAVYLGARLVDEQQKAAALARAEHAGARTPPLVVRTDGEMLRLPQDQIHCIEAARNYCCIVSDAGTHVVRQPLSALAARLDPKSFIRVHRSTIIAVARLRTLRALPTQDAIATLQDGREIRVSRGFRAQLEQALAARH